MTGATAALVIACSPATSGPGAGTALGSAHPQRAALPGSVSRAVNVSKGCPGHNAEVVTATAAPRFVYDLWIGCSGIGYARSTDGGLTFSKPVTAPGSGGASWDPAIAVGPTGFVYLAFMHQANRHAFPVVDASFDHGASFPQVSQLLPAKVGNWGDRDFIAVGKAGAVYVTWDYGPSAALVKFLCSPTGSCAFKAGDVNTVIQKSADGGKTWGPIIPVSPHFPRGGGYSAPVLVEPSGRVDLLSWGHHVSKPPSYALHPGHEFFASSASGTTWPAHLTEVGAPAGPIALPTWWIDGDLSRDAGGTLYATWDTQTSAGDVGWLSFSTDDGVSWSAPFRVTPDTDTALHIVQVLGGPAGVAYVAWQTDAPAAGYATYLRPYAAGKGWLGPRITVSDNFGNRKIWPGDTFGLAALPGGHATRLALSWGSAVNGASHSEIWAAVVTLPAWGRPAGLWHAVTSRPSTATIAPPPRATAPARPPRGRCARIWVIPAKMIFPRTFFQSPRRVLVNNVFSRGRAYNPAQVDSPCSVHALVSGPCGTRIRLLNTAAGSSPDVHEIH